MANPKRITSSGQIFTGRGIIELISLASDDQASFADIYDGIYTDGIDNATHLWHIKTPANDYRDTDILNIPWKKGVFAIIAGTGAGVAVTIR